ncbi:MAG TPA: DUF4907 domain-containing protein [Chitinophagaceae bacterium]|jgi:hypothetical protein|nr:DUF4907 domain-containing protein [Chitinophagaceae bacterium]
MRTIIKSNGFIIAVAVIISALIFIFGRPEKKINTRHQFAYITFDQPAGWGYEIRADGKIFIHQDFIPALAAEKGFRKKEYAEKAAAMVIQKLQQDQLPTLTIADLRHICSLDSIAYEQPANR